MLFEYKTLAYFTDSHKVFAIQYMSFQDKNTVSRKLFTDCIYFDLIYTSIAIYQNNPIFLIGVFLCDSIKPS